MGSRSRRTSERCASRWLSAALGSLALAAALEAAASSGYHLLRTIEIPALTGWDYLSVDPQTRQLFLSNNSGVIVVNADTLQTEGTVPHPASLPGVGLVHGVAFANALDRGFISHEIPASVMIFDLHTLARVGETPTDPGTDAIVYDASSQRVFTMNGKHRGVHDVTVIDATSGRGLGQIQLPGIPEFAVSDAAGHLYVNIASRNELSRIDTHTLKLTDTWALPGCQGPGGLAIDAQHHRLFVGCDNRLLTMIDADSGKVLASVPSGEGTDAVRFDAGTGLAFASNGESGTLTIAREDGDQLMLITELPTAAGARTMALDPTTHRVFLLTAKFAAPPAHATVNNPHRYPRAIRGSGRLLVFGY